MSRYLAGCMALLYSLSHATPFYNIWKSYTRWNLWVDLTRYSSMMMSVSAETLSLISALADSIMKNLDVLSCPVPWHSNACAAKCKRNLAWCSTRKWMKKPSLITSTITWSKRRVCTPSNKLPTSWRKRKLFANLSTPCNGALTTLKTIHRRKVS